MSSQLATNKVIVSSGNHALYAGGQSLWDCPDCVKKGKKVKVFYNGYPGQLVAYVIDDATSRPVSVDEGDIPSIAGEVYIGQFIDKDGDGTADGVRHIAGQSLVKCDLDSVEVVAPACGQPQILAAYLDCIKCDETYTVQFRYSDNQTQSFGKLRADEEVITTSIQTECCSCDDCAPEANCDEVIGKLVDALNGDLDVSINGKSYPDRKYGNTLPKPYRAVKLHSNHFVYCLAPTEGECGGCDEVAPIVEAVINGETVTFKGNLNAAGDATNLAQLDNIASQIECGFEKHIGPHSGFAFVTGGGKDCCAAQLHVVTCDDSFVLSDGEGTYDSCQDINLFDPFIDKKKTTGRDCSTGDCVELDDKVTDFCCGLGVIIDQDRFDCDCPCDISKPPAWFGRTGELFFVKDIDDCTPTIKAREILCPKFPVNTGGLVKWEEYAQDNDNEHWRAVSERQGWDYSLRSDKVGRARNAAAFSDCRKSYCSYHLSYSSVKEGIVNTLYKERNKTAIYIPISDDVTRASWEAFQTALVDEAQGKCKVVGSATCAEKVAENQGPTPLHCN